MLHGRVIRPPAIGAKLLSVDESSIRDIPDVRVVRIENFLGVVAPDEWAAVRAARELKATWSEWQGLPGNDGLERYVREGAVDRERAVSEQRRYRRGAGCGAQAVLGELSVAVPEPCLARPFLRCRRRAHRWRDGLDVHARNVRSARVTCRRFSAYRRKSCA